MKNRILHLTRNTIPYVKELHAIAGGVLGCLVMQQLDYWFENHPEGFYKFLLPSDHPAYKVGDSWTEELGMSKDEFRTAFDKIGIRYKSKSEFDKATDKFQGRFYCSYVDRRSNLTYYFRNHDLVDAALDCLLSNLEPKPSKPGAPSGEQPQLDADFTVKRESRFTGKQEPRFTRNRDSAFTVNRNNPSPLYRDYNTETTTTTENSGAINPGGCSEGLIFPKCTEDESNAIRQLLSDCPPEMQQAALDEIEGARQAGVIKTSLVPFARGVIKAINRNTFSVGHGVNVIIKRQGNTKQSQQSRNNDLLMETAVIEKGKLIMKRLAVAR